MREQNKTVYYCEHCKKHGLSKYHMALHEKWCNRNPDNFRLCHGCKNLEKTTVTYYVDGIGPCGEYIEVKKTSDAFHCKVKGVNVLPLIIFKRGWDKKFDFDGEPMPKECSLFDNSDPIIR